MAERLDKRVAHLGRLTRTEATRVIRRGLVAVDGVEERDPARKIGPEAALTLDGRPLVAPPRLAILHKPVGVVSTVGDPQGRESLGELAADLLILGLHPVGRLDADSEGLLPFSADGALTQRLLHPRHAVEKVYLATVDGRPGPELVDVLAAGVATADGVFSGQVRAIDGDQVTVAVTEGKHRMVRRMLANAGFPVVALRRIAFGAMTLGELPVGGWRAATDDELRWADALIR